METEQAIKKRRSIRGFEEKPVDESTVESLIELAMYAPSAGNEQPWEFIIIDSESTKKQIAAKHDNARMVKDAPVSVLVCVDLKREKHEDMWIQDCAAATQNLLLGARDRNLATCWVGVYPREPRMKDMSEFLDLPENVIPFSLIPVGYSAEEPEQPERFKPERIHKNKWS